MASTMPISRLSLVPVLAPPLKAGTDDGGAGGDRLAAIATVGVVSTVMPSRALAAAAVPRLAESAVITADVVVEAGTAMVAVIITEAATTLMVTADGSTPATSATEFWRADVSW